MSWTFFDSFEIEVRSEILPDCHARDCACLLDFLLHLEGMPCLWDIKSNRRSFVQNGVLMTALMGVGDLRAQANNQSLHLALLSDTHIPADKTNEYRGFRPWDNLHQIVPQLLETKPESILINGDAARLTGELADYEELKKLLKPIAMQCPVFVAMGNHDNRDHFEQVIQPDARNKAQIENKHVTVIEHPAIRIVQLDSLLYVNKVAGLLGEDQRDWLKAFLKQADDRPIVFFVHHTLGQGDGDLLDTDRFFHILAPHPQVKAIFYGHSHVYEYAFREGKHLINLPAVGYNFSDTQPVGWLDAQFHMKGVDLELNAIGGNRNDHKKITSLKWG